MNIVPQRWILRAVGLVLPTMVTACAVGVDGGGYDTEVGVSYVGGYYEPMGYDYGGWGHGYHAGPPRGGEQRPGASSHAYQSAPSAHRTPSIPTRSRKR